MCRWPVAGIVSFASDLLGAVESRLGLDPYYTYAALGWALYLLLWRMGLTNKANPDLADRMMVVTMKAGIAFTSLLAVLHAIGRVR